MDQLHGAADKLFTEIDHLDRILEDFDPDDEDQVRLALSMAKHVRQHSTLLVRALAALRDQLLQA